jgi:NAD(P)-dependent dehydrogenase (short-subunit alcohol dehydrogenase family)
MTTQLTVLLVGGTGRTGRRVLEQLLGRGIGVRAIVRSADRLPTAVVSNPKLHVVVADLLSLSDAELRDYVRGCDAVISCLGHVMSLRGLFGPPRDLVEQATMRLCRAIEAEKPETPIKFILMSNVSLHRPGGLDTRRGTFETALVAVLGLTPPVRDNQRAADFLWSDVRPDNPFVQWVGIRPDKLLDGGILEYAVHEGLVGRLNSHSTNMANVAHFMCELATDPKVWDDWKGKLPVVVNTGIALVSPASATSSASSD